MGSPGRCSVPKFVSSAPVAQRKTAATGAMMMNGSDFVLPPGFRFHPTDEELVVHYLCRRCVGMPLPIPVIAEVDLYKYDPWQLPGMALYGEKEWYFFSPRDRKYPNGSRPNRAAGTGYWKATGADKPIGSSRPVAIKKALVFYSGKPPKGEKTNWIMHEYRLADVDRSARKQNATLRFDDWVLCRIYHKKGAVGKQAKANRKPSGGKNHRQARPQLKMGVAEQASTPKTEMICFDSFDSLPRLLGESSGSDHVSSDNVLSSPELAGEWEVESQPRWEDDYDDWEKSQPRWEDDYDDWEKDLGVGFTEEDNGIFGSALPPLSPALFSGSFSDLYFQ